MAVGSAVLAVLAALGISFAAEGAHDVVNSVGVWSSNKWRKYLVEIQKVLDRNSQKLADFKSLNAEKKANLINSIIMSSGLGARANSIRQEFNRLASKEKEVTNENLKIQDTLRKQTQLAETKINNAGTGIIGAISAATERPGYSDLSNLNQNIDGGINHEKIW